LAISPAGPTGFRRNDRARETVGDRRITFVRYRPDDQQVEINRIWGPTFDTAPQRYGVYGNSGVADPDFYLGDNPYEDLLSRGSLNGWDTATDFTGGACQAVFAWSLNLPAATDVFSLDVRLPVGDFRGENDLQVLRNPPADTLETNNRDFWLVHRLGRFAEAHPSIDLRVSASLHR
jgi:hypothetical protein